MLSLSVTLKLSFETQAQALISQAHSLKLSPLCLLPSARPIISSKAQALKLKLSSLVVPILHLHLHRHPTLLSHIDPSSIAIPRRCPSPPRPRPGPPSSSPLTLPSSNSRALQISWLWLDFVGFFGFCDDGLLGFMVAEFHGSVVGWLCWWWIDLWCFYCSEMDYFIVTDILFYCDIYIILFC